MRMYIQLLLSSLLFNSCAKFSFVPTGFVVEEDHFYHQAKEEFSFDVSPIIEVGKHSDNMRVNKVKIFSSDRKVLRRLDLSPQNSNVYFSLRSNSNEHLLLLKPKNQSFLKEGLSSQFHVKGTYYYKKIKSKGTLIQYAVVPYRGKELGLICYESIGSNISKFDFFLEHALSLNKSNFFPDKTEIDCSDKIGNISVELPEKLIFPLDYSLFKIYKIDDNGSKKLEVFTLRQPNELPYATFKVCEGNYEILYTDLKHDVFWKENVIVKADL